MATVQRLSRRYHADVLNKMIFLPALKVEDLKDKAKADSWFSELATQLNADDSSGVRYDIVVEEDQEHGAWQARINSIRKQFVRSGLEDERYVHQRRRRRYKIAL